MGGRRRCIRLAKEKGIRLPFPGHPAHWGRSGEAVIEGEGRRGEEEEGGGGRKLHVYD